MRTSARLFPLWITVLLALLLAACSVPGGEPTSPTEAATTAVAAPVSLPREAEALAAADNALGFDLLAQLRPPDATDNLFFSPLSLALALQMTYSGAAGDTAAEMAEVLHLPDFDPSALDSANASLQSSLRSAADVDLLIANSLWARQGLTLREPFVQRVRDGYEAEVTTLDFSDPSAVETINGWVNDSTRGEIETLLQNIPEDVVLYLINAIYFQGGWQTPFERERTQEQPFTLPSSETVTVPMMRRDGFFLYSQGENFQLAALPYGDGRLRMNILLPSDEVALAEVLAGLDAETWRGWTAEMEEERLTVGLPRFAIEYEAELSAVLQRLGMTRAFGDADFSEMVEDGGIFISAVLHKAVVEVNEEGTVAAAVSAVEMEDSEPPSFIVDRPFFFTIEDGASGAILFVGVVNEPMQAE